MPVNELVELRTKKDIIKNTRIKLAINCAPLLKGSKAANIMTVTLQEFYIIKDMLKNTCISCYLLRGKMDMFNLYLYRREQIEHYLAKDCIKDFLSLYGYNTDSFEKMLVRLAVRCKAFSDNVHEFPHEIGVFLEYPIEDVKGFIENKGENFSYIGYWKVYHNQSFAKRLFRQFDREKELVVREMLDGRNILEIVA